MKMNSINLNDKDTILSLAGEGSFFHIYIHNGKEYIASYLSREKLRELATLLNEYLENNNDQ